MNIDWWYKLVSPSLLEKLVSCENDYNRVLASYIESNARALSQQITISALEHTVREMEDKLRKGELSCVLTARDHAATQRIQDLEKDNIFLLGEVHRLKGKLAKFNQK